MTLAYSARGGIPLGDNPWIVFLFVVVVLAFLVASLVGTIRQLSAIAATLKVLFGNRQASAQNPSAPPTVLDGILQLQSFGALRPTSTSGWKIMGGSLQGAATFLPAGLRRGDNRREPKGLFPGPPLSFHPPL